MGRLARPSRSRSTHSTVRDATAWSAGGYARASLLENAAEASVELGLIDRAARLTDEISDHGPEEDDWVLHLVRAQVEICQDATERAVARVDAVVSSGIGGPASGCLREPADVRLGRLVGR